jgi:hypothetical protein
MDLMRGEWGLSMSLTWFFYLYDLGQVLFFIGAPRSLHYKVYWRGRERPSVKTMFPLSLSTHQLHQKGLCTQRPDPWICSLGLQDTWSYAAKWPRLGLRCAGTRMA